MSANNNKPIDEWNLDGVLRELEKFHSTMDDRQFAFILGAGASASSGIPTGHALAQQWLEEIHQRECLDKELNLHTWLDSEQSGWRDKEIKIEEAGSHYPTIFERRFKGDREAGYAALETAMEGKFPSLGFLSWLALFTTHATK